MRPFLEEEVKSTIRGLNGERAPRLDSLPVFFYHNCWDIVGAEVMTIVELFHRGGPKHGLYQPITYHPHSQASGDSGHKGFSAYLPVQLVIPDPSKALGKPVAGKHRCPHQPLSVGVHPWSTNDRQCSACRGDCLCLEVQGHHVFHMEG